MRPSFLILAVSLLLFSLFISEARGIRIKKGSLLSFEQHKIHEERRSMIKDNDATKGMNRKLLITTTTSPPPSSSSSTTPKNEKNTGENKAKKPTSKGKSRDGETLGDQRKFSTNSSPPPAPPTSSQHSTETDISQDHFVDITDIAEMDYSPAKRKPPIHN